MTSHECGATLSLHLKMLFSGFFFKITIEQEINMQQINKTELLYSISLFFNKILSYLEITSCLKNLYFKTVRWYVIYNLHIALRNLNTLFFQSKPVQRYYRGIMLGSAEKVIRRKVSCFSCKFTFYLLFFYMILCRFNT